MKLKTVLVSLWLLFSAAGAGQQRSGKAMPKVDVGDDTTLPGMPAIVSLSLVGGEGAQVVKVRCTIRLNKLLLEWVATERGPAAESAEAEIQTSQKSDERDPQTLLLQVATWAQKPIPEGQLLKLKFNVSQNAQPNTPIMLKSSASVTLTDGTELQLPEEDLGQIQIAEPPPSDLPVTACFFYMH